MSRKRAPYVRRWAWYVILGVGVVVVVGFAVVGYEISHLRNEVNQLTKQVQGANKAIALLYTEIARLLAGK